MEPTFRIEADADLLLAMIREYFVYDGHAYDEAPGVCGGAMQRVCEVRSIHLEVVRQNSTAQEVYRRAGYADHDHFLMSKWIERGFAKPGTGSH